MLVLALSSISKTGKSENLEKHHGSLPEMTLTYYLAPNSSEFFRTSRHWDQQIVSTRTSAMNVRLKLLLVWGSRNWKLGGIEGFEDFDDLEDFEDGGL